MGMKPLGNRYPLDTHPSLARSKGRKVGLETAQQEKQGEKAQERWVPKVCCLVQQ